MTDIADGLITLTPDCETHPRAFPLRDAAVLLVGYGVGRVLLPRWRAREPDAELWSLNGESVPGETRHFQIHTPDRAAGMERLRGWDPVLFAARGVRVYTHDDYPFPAIRRGLLCSTVDYMLALADVEGFSRVYMPGLDFGGTRDPREVYSARYWVGVLEGKGAKVYRTPFSRMFEEEVYR